MNAVMMSQIVLSHMELAYLLQFYGVTPTIGVDRNPYDGFSAEQVAAAYATAEAALRARGLLLYDADQQPLIESTLLEILEHYARPSQVITAYRYAGDDEYPSAFFVHQRNGAGVVHARPDDLLHQFSLVPNLASLAEELTAFCTGAHIPAQAPKSMTLPASTMAAARLFAETGRSQEIVDVLKSAGVSDVDADLLAANLITPSALTAITLLKVDGSSPRRDCVYWQSETNNSALLIIYARKHDTPSQSVDEVVVADGSSATILSMLNETI